ncbi:methyltransferase family protein [Actinoalloteichus hymeniacidonis]|uniref:Methyltransferase family protein n=1 Tax=Actinoalloteichus hymeniacidonis TaxID=340345 RepID=A0AAC9MXQ4_9PSEU|nr:methyltransferase family protein [Actinoalloteichus hymeniacidonis]
MALWSVRDGFRARARRTWASESSGTGVLPSPNIWHWPEVYELENRAQDQDRALFAALAQEADWTDADVVDVGCGDGFHLPLFAQRARSVLGVEPHPPLVRRARQRMSGFESVRIAAAGAQRLPIPDSSVDLVHARTAYFFGPGCEPGLREADRVLRPGGMLAIIDLDASRHAYGTWMRADLPRYSPGAVEEFFAAEGFECRRIDTRWRFEDRQSLGEVLRIEFSRRVAARAIAQTPGVEITVAYRLHTRRKPRTPLLP